MNGPHDLGGQMGFGPISPETDEPAFHADWEKHALGVTLCAGALGNWSLDESRHARETLHPADYYSSSYYEIWIKALEKLLLRHGCVTEQELSEGHALEQPGKSERILTAERVPAAMAAGSPCDRPVDTEPVFSAGDRVRARNIHPHGHTRLPRYVRGKVGRIERVNGSHVFPDSNAHGKGERPQWLYTVVFAGDELWGAYGDAKLNVSIDAWESYLEPA
jgi:nitrile hydratase